MHHPASRKSFSDTITSCRKQPFYWNWANEQSYLCEVLYFNRQNLTLVSPPNDLVTAYGTYWKYPHWTSKNSMRCVKKCFYDFGDSNSGMSMPEIVSYRGGWGERSCPRGATAFHSVSVKWTHNLPTVRRTLPLSYRRQCLGVRWCYDSTVGRYWGTNDTRKRIMPALTIHRDFKQNFIRVWEGQ